VQFVAAGVEGPEDRDRPRGSGELDETQDPALADDLDPAQLLRQNWEELDWADIRDELDWAEERAAPFGRSFPAWPPVGAHHSERDHAVAGRHARVALLVGLNGSNPAAARLG